jgi:phosphate transport system ATP-binding protein
MKIMAPIKVEAKAFNLYYGDFQALKDIYFKAEEHTITAFIGPSGCGKSTMLRSFNRMNDLIEGSGQPARRWWMASMCMINLFE